MRSGEDLATTPRDLLTLHVTGPLQYSGTRRNPSDAALQMPQAGVARMSADNTILPGNTALTWHNAVLRPKLRQKLARQAERGH